MVVIHSDAILSKLLVIVYCPLCPLYGWVHIFVENTLIFCRVLQKKSSKKIRAVRFDLTMKFRLSEECLLQLCSLMAGYPVAHSA